MQAIVKSDHSNVLQVQSCHSYIVSFSVHCKKNVQYWASTSKLLFNYGQHKRKKN